MHMLQWEDIVALSKRVQVLMDPDEYEWIRRTAEREGVSVCELARAALRQVHGPPPPDGGDHGPGPVSDLHRQTTRKWR